MDITDTVELTSEIKTECAGMLLSCKYIELERWTMKRQQKHLTGYVKKTKENK